MGSSRLRITVAVPGAAARAHDFESGAVTVGSSAGNDLVLAHATVLPVHLWILGNDEVAEGLHARAAAEAHGVGLNGGALVDERIQAGDLLRLGEATLEIDAPAATEDCREPPARADADAISTLGSSATATAPGEARTARANAGSAHPERRPGEARPESKGVAGSAALPPPAAATRVLAPPRRGASAARLAVLGATLIAAVGAMGAAAVQSRRAARPGTDAGATDPARGAAVVAPRPLREVRPEEVFGAGPAGGATNPGAPGRLAFSFPRDDDGAAGPMALELAFEARGIERAGQVVILLNDRTVASVPASLSGEMRLHSVRLPRAALRKGSNTLVFETSASGGGGPWAISRVRLESRPLPLGTSAELAERARAGLERAEQRLRHRDIAAGNRYDAWASLRRAQLFADAVAEEDGAPLQGPLRLRLRELEQELEAVCNRALLAGKRHEELGRPELAVREYEYGLQWFPGDEHDCRSRLRARLAPLSGAR